MDAKERHEAELTAAAERAVSRAASPVLARPVYVASESPLRRRKRIPNRRTLKKLTERMHELTRELVEMLERADGVASAREVIAQADLADCIVIAESRAELVRAVVDRLRDGDSACADMGEPLVGIEFWRK